MFNDLLFEPLKSRTNGVVLRLQIHIAYVLSYAKYCVVCRYMCVWANNANNNIRCIHLVFLTYKKWNVISSGVMSFRTLNSKFQG